MLVFTVIPPCHVSFSIVCPLRLIWTINSFVTYVVIFSAVSANSFSSASCFCVSVCVAIMIYHGSVLILVYNGIWWLSRDEDIIQLFLQVEGKKYSRSVRFSWLDETRFNCIFNEWVLFFYFFFRILHWIRSFFVDKSFNLVKKFVKNKSRG